MGKHKHSKVKVVLNISGGTEIHAIPKAWDEWIPIVRKKYGKKNKHSKIMRFLNISCEAETHTIPKPRNERIPILRDKYGKT